MREKEACMSQFVKLGLIKSLIVDIIYWYLVRTQNFSKNYYILPPDLRVLVG